MEIFDIGIAHQKKIRDLKSETEKHDLFGSWWENINIDIKKAIVKPISLSQSKKIIEEYEWLGCLSAITKYQFGIFFDNYCGGVVTYSPEYIENLGKWDKYDYTGKILLLSRGVCLHWAHPHAASRLISQSMKMLPKKYKIITATTDHLAGEIGTIYQACNFYYVGSMRDANPNVNSRNGDRDGWLINGKLYGARAIRQKFGTTKLEIIKEVYPDVEKVKQNSKHRYFYFLGDKKEKKYHFKKIEHLVKPYPKRL
jgi:hypothetical protein